MTDSGISDSPEVTDERIYEDLKAYQDAGMIEYVLPTEPIGEEWIIGYNGRILKFATKEGIIGFLAGIQVGSMFAIKLRGTGCIPLTLWEPS
jgi:hypothetical protein